MPHQDTRLVKLSGRLGPSIVGQLGASGEPEELLLELLEGFLCPRFALQGAPSLGSPLALEHSLESPMEQKDAAAEA